MEEDEPVPTPSCSSSKQTLPEWVQLEYLVTASLRDFSKGYQSFLILRHLVTHAKTQRNIRQTPYHAMGTRIKLAHANSRRSCR
jgi:hypothetical protein